MEKLKGDFENLSIAIADLPVGLIPFPDRCALLKQYSAVPSQLSTRWCIPAISTLQSKDCLACSNLSSPKILCASGYRLGCIHPADHGARHMGA